MSEGKPVSNGELSVRDRERLAVLADADGLFRVVKFLHPNGKTYHLKTMSVEEEGWMGEQSRSADGEKADPARFTAAVVQATLCDERGELLFGLTDIPILAKKPALFLKPLAMEAMKVNAVGNVAVEEAEKNSEATPGDSSSTASPATST